MPKLVEIATIEANGINYQNWTTVHVINEIGAPPLTFNFIVRRKSVQEVNVRANRQKGYAAHDVVIKMSNAGKDADKPFKDCWQASKVQNVRK
jgi:hypothetical protein